MSDWPGEALARIADGQPAVLVTLLAVEGSVPREAGTRMLVWSGGQWGTIGGGALEYQASHQARRMLERGAEANFAIQDYPLGPLLAQCCGGRARLLLERLDGQDVGWMSDIDRLARAGRGFELRRQIEAEGLARSVTPHIAAWDDPDPQLTINGRPAQARAPRPGQGDEIGERSPPPRPDLALFGAGHVGQAVARALQPLAFRVAWYDSRPELAGRPEVLVRERGALIKAAAQAWPFMLVLTHDHALDYALTAEALAAGGNGHLGLIGSRTKRARFISRLRADGFSEAALQRLVCPIGLPQLTSKAPEVIAVSVAADLLLRLQARRQAPVRELALAGL
jgi:xanthine dehydrogenase accessory factor